MSRHKYYDKYKRDQHSRAFYNSQAWADCRRIVLIRDNYLCQECFKSGNITPADMVHHIEEIKVNPDRALDETNLISLCNPCHNKEHPYRGSTKKNPEKKRVNVIKVKANKEIT